MSFAIKRYLIDEIIAKDTCVIFFLSNFSLISKMLFAKSARCICYNKNCRCMNPPDDDDAYAFFGMHSFLIIVWHFAAWCWPVRRPTIASYSLIKTRSSIFAVVQSRLLLNKHAVVAAWTGCRCETNCAETAKCDVFIARQSLNNTLVLLYIGYSYYHFNFKLYIMKNADELWMMISFILRKKNVED